MDKLVARGHRKSRIRKKISGTSERPRLSVYRSLKNIFVQIIDDHAGKTLVAASTSAKDFGEKENAGNVKGAKALGQLVAKKALAKGIGQVVFDRGGFLYHGRVKALADGVREGGVKF
ncbi:MAG: 50S ribosomal protein L18 [bacterium]|nr:50S ribosomal protein L18 [bacterium]